MQDKRIIKKYPNRRLYDTEDSKYVTLKDIRNLIFKNKTIIVRDVKTQEDLTRNILLQIIIEQESNGSPFFSAQILTNIIRLYGKPFQSKVGDYLEKKLVKIILEQKFMEDQNNMLKKSKE